MTLRSVSFVIFCFCYIDQLLVQTTNIFVSGESRCFALLKNVAQKVHLGLPQHVTEQTLGAFFARCGPVGSVGLSGNAIATAADFLID